MHRLIPASLLVVAGFNFAWATEPQGIIDFYANAIKDIIIAEKGSAQKTKIAGNVLAYKNYAEQTIVLKSGDYFADTSSNDEANDDVIVVPLEDVVAIVGEKELGSDQNIFNKYTLGENRLSVKKDPSGKSIVFKPLKDEIEKYINLATMQTSKDWQKQFIEHQKNRLKKEVHSLDDAKKAVLNDCEKNIQNLDQLRHTEFQIHAILNSFCSALNTLKLKKDDLMREAVVPKYVKILQLLLPASFALDFQLGSPVYSLFEACNSCKLVPWLNIGVNKNFFMFKVLDAQVLKYGKAVLANFHSQTTAENLQNAITVQIKNSNGQPIEEKITTMDLFNCNFNNTSKKTISSHMIACKYCASNDCKTHSNNFFILQWEKGNPKNLKKNLYQQHYIIEIKDNISPLLQDIKTFINDVDKAAKTSSKKGGK